MRFRIALIVLVLCDLFIGYKVASLAFARDLLNKIPQGYYIGPQNGDLSIVEFFDYGCAGCKEIEPALMQAIQRDGRVDYIPRPLPSLSGAGAKYARAAYAAGMQGKFVEMHKALMLYPDVPDDAALADIAKKIGVDPNRLVKDMAGKNTQDRVAVNMFLASFFHPEHAPVFIIGKKIRFQPANARPTPEDFLKLFAEARSAQ